MLSAIYSSGMKQSVFSETLSNFCDFIIMLFSIVISHFLSNL